MNPGGQICGTPLPSGQWKPRPLQRSGCVGMAPSKLLLQYQPAGQGVES
jgi:hypothetical protein